MLSNTCEDRTSKAAARKAAVINRLLLSVDGGVVPIKLLANRVVNVTASFLSLFLHDERIRQALSPHGKLLHLEKSSVHIYTGLYTGTRVVRMEM